MYFDKLPSVAVHHMSIPAESASGNNFDLQAETGNRFRFHLANAGCSCHSASSNSLRDSRAFCYLWLDHKTMPVWRNGRRTGLKILGP